MGGSYPGSPALYGNTFPSLTLLSYTDNGSNQGGLARFSVDFSLLSGANSFVFNFGLNPPAGEGWGLSNMLVTADILTTQPQDTSLPEPETYTLMLAALGVMGVVMRRRKTMKA